VTSLALATLLQASIMVVGTEGYAEARQETTETGKPMVVLVSAEWCGACQEMRHNAIAEVRKQGLMQKVSFAVVNMDREKSLAQKLMGGSGPIPQLVMYRKNGDRWLRKKLVGGQSAKAIEEFILEGVARDEAAKHDLAEQQEASPEEDASPEVAQKPEAESAQTR
jgi:thioredoxin-like negative regulator of GroEL